MMKNKMNLSRAIEDAKPWLDKYLSTNDYNSDEVEYGVAQVGLRLWVQTLILGLHRKNYNNTDIARAITEMGEHCTGATVSRWLSGKISPKTKRFMLLERLHDKVVKKGKVAWRGQ